VLSGARYWNRTKNEKATDKKSARAIRRDVDRDLRSFFPFTKSQKEPMMAMTL